MRENHGHGAIRQATDGSYSHILGWQEHSVSEKLERQVDEVEPVLVEISQPLGLVPLDQHELPYTEKARPAISVYENQLTGSYPAYQNVRLAEGMAMG